MSRTTRLLDLVQRLRDGRLHKAGALAAALGVSPRTIWRDMDVLRASGLPIEGERGVGYILRIPVSLPPLVLSPEELAALRLGLAQVAQGAAPPLARAAGRLAAKIDAVMPGAAETAQETEAETPTSPALLPRLRRALRLRERLSITYLDHQGRQTHRDIRPLRLALWGQTYVLTAYCEGRQQPEEFRIDRILALTETGETFPKPPTGAG